MVSPFANVEVGDKLVRLLGGQLPMRVTVECIDVALIHCAGGWRFSRETGAEIDEDIGWDGFRVTGSYLLPPSPTHGTVWCWTESGSRYVIDYGRRTWRRESDVALVRSNPGVALPSDEFWHVAPIAIGKGLLIIAPAVGPASTPRVVASTPVVRIREEQQGS
jgi:hypothetical protein